MKVGGKITIEMTNKWENCKFFGILCLKIAQYAINYITNRDLSLGIPFSLPLLLFLYLLFLSLSYLFRYSIYYRGQRTLRDWSAHGSRNKQKVSLLTQIQNIYLLLLLSLIENRYTARDSGVVVTLLSSNEVSFEFSLKLSDEQRTGIS